VTPLAQGQLLSADLAGDATIVTAPNLPAQANWVLTADGTAGAGGTNMLWKPVTGGGGIINATLPLVDDAGVGTNTISIDFSAGPAGQIPYGNGTAKTGALTNTPVAGQILGVNAGVPAWINAGGSGTVTALAPLTEYAVGSASNIAIDFTAKGDLVAGGGPQAGGDPVAGVVLPVGTNGYILQANSATLSGLEWVAGGSGGIADGSIMGYNDGHLIYNTQSGAVGLYQYGIWQNPTPTAQAWTQTGLGSQFTIENGENLIIYNPIPTPGVQSFYPFPVTRWGTGPIVFETGDNLLSGALNNYNTALSAGGQAPIFEIFTDQAYLTTPIYTKGWSAGDPDFPPFGSSSQNWAFTLNYTHTAPQQTLYCRFGGNLGLPWTIPVIVNYTGFGPLPTQPIPYILYEGNLEIAKKHNLRYTGTTPIYVSVNLPTLINTYLYNTLTVVDLLTVAGGAYAYSNFILGVECRNSATGNVTSTEGTLVLGASNVTSIGEYQGCLTWNGFMMQNDYLAIRATGNAIFNANNGGSPNTYTAKVSLGNFNLYACNCGFTPLS
jgi:hypothetical protein